ncbi:S49 family peptidase [Bradyrhizobium sp.]|uniref:S49 family peptidase n=1 Tax=Bradyrhizobium sp. TaxID=376 RepID=UPI0025BEB8DB|nr:S49 family peptidase [Bradyrhizobium sp.]
MTTLLRIAERVMNRPLLIHPDKVPLVLGILEGRYPIDVTTWREDALRRIDDMPEAARTVMRGPAPSASRFPGSVLDTDPETGRQRTLPYNRHNGVALIPIIGTTINRGAWIGSNSGEVSYEGIKHQIETAVADPRTHAIMLDIESPGGEAVGAFEAADAVRAARQSKPVVAVVNGMAASAAYAIASGASRIITTPTGVSGSIGVVLIHADYSRQLDKRGITPTLIFAGAHKVDGNPFEPLSESVRADLKREVDAFYELFIAAVAHGRGGLTPAAIRATEARTFIGVEAVSAGLADEVGSFESVLQELSSGQAGRPINVTRSMTTMSAETISRTEHEAEVARAVAAATAAADAMRIEALAEGARAESARQAGIDRLAAEMPGHTELVAKLKADPNVSVEQAAVQLIGAEGTRRGSRRAAIEGVERVAAGNLPATPAASERQSPDDVGARAAANTAPHVVAAKAREYAATQKARGVKVSAAEAVAHVTDQIKTGSLAA